MGTFILLLIIFFIVIPMFKGVMALYRARKAARQYFEQFRRQTGNNNSRQQRPEPQKPKKKINPDDGEFVSFEDIPGQSEPSAAQSTTKVKVEQQIVDVEWEDLP